MLSVFNTYDKDKNGTLDKSEVTMLINDALKQMKRNRKVTQEEVDKFLAHVDKDRSDSVSKE